MGIFTKGNGKRIRKRGMGYFNMQMVILMLGCLLMGGRKGKGFIDG